MLCEAGVGIAKRTTAPFFSGVALTSNGRSLLQERTVGHVVNLRHQQQHSLAITAAAPTKKQRSSGSSARRWAMTGRVLGNSSKQREGDVSTHAFGSSFEESYDVSEPQKVNEASLGDPPEGNADVIEKIKRAFVNFKENKFQKEPDLFNPLKEGQKPKVMIVACADSRVSPTMLMGLEPGEVFIVRNVANLVHPYEGDKLAGIGRAMRDFPYLAVDHEGCHGMFNAFEDIFEPTINGESAALLFAVTGLLVEEIVVMGHRNCGGIKALMSFSPDDMAKSPIGRWISSSEPARDQTLVHMKGKPFADQCKYCELESVNKSLSNLLTFPFIKEKFDRGELGIHGMHYDFVDGELTTWKVKNPALVKA